MNLHRAWLGEDTATVPLWNLSGQLVGYQQYRPNASKEAKNDPREGRYFTRLARDRVGVWGLESWSFSDTLFLCEGVFDACKVTWLGYSALAVFSTEVNGTTRFTSGLNYQFQQNGPNAILRATLTWATNSGMPYTGFDRLIIVRFRLKATSTAYTFNPIKLNFVAGWNANGQYDNTFMSTPLDNTVNMNQNAGKLVTAKVDVNSNLLTLTDLKVSFRDATTNQGVLFNVNSNGTVDINQSQLQENKT
jgi:hypothetical protein